MARTVSQWAPVRHESFIRTSKYPWDEWCNGDIWEVVRGQDFDGTAPGFRSTCFQQATRRGCRVTTRVIDNRVVQFRFYSKAEDESEMR